MTMRAVYSYANPDSTTDMNAHFRILFSKGIVSGGLISPVGGTYQVTVAPFTAVSADGMVVENDTTTTLTIPTTGTLYHVVLIAQYNAPSAPTLQLQVVSSSTYETTDTTNLIILGSVQIVTGSTAQAGHITYGQKHATARVGAMPFKGFLGSEGAAPTGSENKIGDLYLVLGTPPYFIAYNSNEQWTKFSDYSQLEASYEAHVTNAGAYTGTDRLTKGKHVTPDILAACAGTAGTPSATNKFVTTADQARTLDAGEREGLTAALGGTLSATNPVVSKNLSVLEERVVAYTALTGGQNTASVVTTINSATVSVFVGNRGKEAAVGGATSGVSTARQFFRVEDGLGKGLVINGKAIYVTDVTLNGVSFDTSGEETNDEGFWLGTGALSVVFNSLIPAGQAFYLRYNIKGNVASLSPANRGVGTGSKYAIPPTGYQNRIESYIETYVLNAQSVVANSLEVTGRALFDNGTAAAPSIAFSDDPLTGMFYAGTTTNSAFENYSGLGFAVNGQRMMVMGRAASNIDIESYHVLEADIDAEGNPYHKWSVQQVGGDDRKATFMFGLSNYLNDFEPFYGIRYGLTLEENFGKLFEPYVSVQRDIAIESFTTAKYKLSVMSGTADAPSICFNKKNSGFYYFDRIGDAVHSLYSGVGVSVNGAPLVVFGNDSLTTEADSKSILMVERSNLDEGIRFGMWSSGSGPGPLRIGYSNYVTDWTDTLVIEGGYRITSYVPLEIQSDLDVTGNAVVGTLNSQGDALAAKYSVKFPGSKTVPAFGFSGDATEYGMFLEDAAANAQLYFGRLLSFAVDGKSQLALGKDPWTVGSSASMTAPLMINSFADGAAEFGYHISVPYLGGGGTPNWKNTISFGTSTYIKDFEESLTFTTNVTGTGAWYLYSGVHIDKRGSLFIHNEDATDVVAEWTAVELSGIRSDYLDGAAAFFDGRLAAKSKIVVGTTESSADVSTLVLGSGSVKGEFDESTCTILKNWGKAQTAPVNLAGAFDDTPTVAGLADTIKDLIKVLGYNTNEGANLHSLFEYTK